MRMNVKCSKEFEYFTWNDLENSDVMHVLFQTKSPLCILNIFGRARNTLYPLSQSNSPFLFVFGALFFSLFSTGV
jgi:hypothetical protein